jgi:hypothetical protein
MYVNTGMFSMNIMFDKKAITNTDHKIHWTMLKNDLHVSLQIKWLKKKQIEKK